MVKWIYMLFVVLSISGCLWGGSGTSSLGTLLVTVEPGSVVTAASDDVVLLVQRTRTGAVQELVLPGLPGAQELTLPAPAQYYVWLEIRSASHVRRSLRFTVQLTASGTQLALDLDHDLPDPTEPAQLRIAVRLDPKTPWMPAADDLEEFTAAAAPAQALGPTVHEVRLSLKLQPGADPELLVKAGWEILEMVPALDRVIVRRRTGDYQPAAADLQLVSELILSQDPVLYYYAQEVLTPNDPLYKSQPNLPAIQLPAVWPQTTGHHQIRIAVLDTRVDPQHQDLNERLDLADAAAFVNDPGSYESHGTHVAGIIGAASNNRLGVAGVDWEAVLVPITVLGASGRGSTVSVADGMLYAAGLAPDREGRYISRPVDIMNLSLGIGVFDQHLSEAVAKVLDAGILIVAAAGNQNQDTVIYPAAYDGVIAVAAADLSSPLELSSFSNYGQALDIAAPGRDILSTFDNDLYGRKNGTSMATPHVTGALSLLLATGLAPDAAWEALRDGAVPIPVKHTGRTVGFLQVATAMGLVDWDEVKPLLPPLAEVHLQPLDTVDPHQEELVILLSWSGSSHLWPQLSAGRYRISGWLDANESGTLEPGDYYFETELYLWPGWSHEWELVLQRY